MSTPTPHTLIKRKIRNANKTRGAITHISIDELELIEGALKAPKKEKQKKAEKVDEPAAE